jgi:hypothetical protein
LIRIILLALCLAGCQLKWDSIPGQEQAIDIVWNQLYQADRSPPQIQWIDAFDCGGGHAFFRDKYFGGPKSDICVSGVFWPDLYVTQVGHYPDTAFLFSASAFSHELWHAHMDNQRLYDPEHKDPGFGLSFGHPFGIVDQAEQLLRDAGL